MAILSHGSDLTLAPTIKPIVQASGATLRRSLSDLAAAGVESVQLDASLRGIRPRELSATGRRDLCTSVVRAGLRLAGLDLFVPRKHLLEGQHVDRAVSSLVEAVKLAADLGRVPLSLALPLDGSADEAVEAVLEAADGHGVSLAVHAERELDDAAAALAHKPASVVGLGLDPATLILRGGDPVAAAQQHGKRLASCRLSDADRDLGQRCAVGAGDLDLTSYRVSVDLASSRVGPVVLDLRGLNEPMAATRRAMASWDDASFSLRGDAAG